MLILKKHGSRNRRLPCFLPELWQNGKQMSGRFPAHLSKFTLFSRSVRFERLKGLLADYVLNTAGVLRRCLGIDA